MVSGLAGKTMLVTGAAKRIGRAIAIRLSELGARVAIHYHGSEEEAQSTARECAWQGEPAPLFRANFEHVPEIRAMFADVERRLGRLDGLVNNAARFTLRNALEITEQDWDFIHSVNLKAVFFCCQSGAMLMNKTGGGRIVNISSLGGLRPWSRHAHYCASKAGAIMLTRALSKAFAPAITVNSVAPGVIPFGDPDARVKRLIEVTPAKRGGTAEEVAEAVACFLTGPEFITGQVIAVDGGLSQRA